MQERFDSFKEEYWEDLQEMTPEEFNQIKQSTLITLNEKPKT